ncbi:unnamed protein product [Effrenium voratum]|uniref:Tr-type G domain-containing protein n=1 Tax=Effrenium voratum TaxID=2562239 RepID=A0AA36JU12_9DINO|nr:unnamed protein product [Effrenium voratum]CAJ1411553.1 unnamed protein product [Effrenium voratum]CAJ1418338.1 unnamed protein product [Effrenium voratum]
MALYPVSFVVPEVPRASPSQSSTTERRPPAKASANAASIGLTAVAGAVAGLRRRSARRVRLPPLRVATLDKPGVIEREDIRNIAIIAHVDHGKTTLTNALMTQCGMSKLKSMDSDQLEQERGITILAKNAAVTYKGIKINIVDTPGHADFGGEVERILNMADACLLLVDAAEGPMPQTKFVLRQALKLGKKLIVCINKVDKPASRVDWVLDTTFDLFGCLGADDEACDFPVVYASGFQGVASVDGPEDLQEDLKPLLDTILEETPLPKVDPEAPLQMLVSNLDYDDYVGRICIGRLMAGSLKVGSEVGFMYGEKGGLRKGTVSKLWQFQNNDRVPVDEVTAGDICCFAGMSEVKIGDTVVDMSNPTPLPPIQVEEPTVAMEFATNKSPFAGKAKESTKVTPPQIKARLEKECLTNLALRVEPGSTSESFKVKGRGTLQLGILMENMRREGFEFMVSAPEVLLRKDPETRKTMEPFEEVVIDVPNEYQGVVLEEMQKKGGVMKTMESGAVPDTSVLTFDIPTRNTIGMPGKFAQRTSGTAVMSSQFSHWGEFDGNSIKLREKGSIVTVATGKTTFYSLENFKNRGKFFVDPAEEVYAGQVIGLSNKDIDLNVNITKEKAASNMREKTGTVTGSIAPKIQMSIDDWLGHMDTDEILEVTPLDCRLAKKNPAKVK